MVGKVCRRNRIDTAVPAQGFAKLSHDGLCGKRSWREGCDKLQMRALAGMPDVQTGLV